MIANARNWGLLLLKQGIYKVLFAFMTVKSCFHSSPNKTHKRKFMMFCIFWNFYISKSDNWMCWPSGQERHTISDVFLVMLEVGGSNPGDSETFSFQNAEIRISF